MPILGIIASSIQKAFAAFSDTFNRTTSSSLGTSSSGGIWESLKGTFFANGYSAQSDDAATTYPISFIKSASENSFTTFVPGNGGVLISTSGTVGSIGAGNGTTGTSGFYWATITGMSSTTGINVGDWIYATNGTGSLYGGTPSYVEVTSIVSSSSITYRTKDGTTPTAGTVTDIYTKGKDGGSGTALWITDSGNWYGVLYGRGQDTSCNCSQCGNGTYSCTGYGQNRSCSGWIQNCTSYSCSHGAAYSWGNYAYKTFGGGVYSYSLTGFTWAYTCDRWTGSGCTTYCSGGYAPDGTYSCSTSVENTSSCNCQTCYPPYISVIKSSSNAVSEVVRWTLTSMASAVKVVSNSVSKTITVRPYKEKAMTNQIGTDLTQNVSTAVTTNKFGIILGPSDQIQGKNIDDFTLGQN